MVENDNIRLWESKGLAKNNFDVVIVGSGVGGGVSALNLAKNGASVLILERGGQLPREDDNWDIGAVFHRKKYTAHDVWYDKDDQPFRPAVYYYIGGCSKFFGASMVRLRERDFESLEHEEGTSPAWPIRYSDLAPYYDKAETLFSVRGKLGTDPTEPPHKQDYPFPPIGHENHIESLVLRMQRQGLKPFPLPQSILPSPQGNCIRCGTCDGFPCKVDSKGDAEICAVKPALETGRVELQTNAYVRRLLLAPDGRAVVGVEYDQNGEIRVARGKIFIISCSAVNSAALLLRSENTATSKGAANSHDLVGRHYMAHNNTALMAVSWKRNPTVFQKTVSLNDFYFGENGYRFPMGNAQLLGKLKSGMLTADNPLIPEWLGAKLAARSVDWWVMSEDLPAPENRVMVDNNRIKLVYTPNNRKAHYRLVRSISRTMRRAGYPFILTKTVGTLSTSHQCGTVRFGSSPEQAPLDEFCRAFDQQNLFVIDSSFFPSSTAMNPALTIAAQALRATDHMLATDFGYR